MAAAPTRVTYLSKGRRAVERADHLFPAFDEDQVCCRAATVLPGGSVGEGLISHENRAPKSLESVEKSSTREKSVLWREFLLVLLIPFPKLKSSRTAPCF